MSQSKAPNAPTGQPKEREKVKMNIFCNIAYLIEIMTGGKKCNSRVESRVKKSGICKPSVTRVSPKI